MFLTWAQHVKDPMPQTNGNGKLSGTGSEMAKPFSDQCESVGHVYKNQQPGTAPLQRLPARTKACWTWPWGSHGQAPPAGREALVQSTCYLSLVPGQRDASSASVWFFSLQADLLGILCFLLLDAACHHLLTN